MIETTTDTLTVPRKRRNEKDSTSRKKRKAEKRKAEEPSDQEDQEEERAIQIPTPEYAPPEFSSEEEMSEEEDSLPIQSHANIDLITFDSLNSSTVQKLIQERDRLEFGNLRKRHTLLHQIDRTQWPVLFQILKLHEKLPSTYVFENKKYFKRFKRLLTEEEDEVMEVLKKQFPQQASAINKLINYTYYK